MNLATIPYVPELDQDRTSVAWPLPSSAALATTSPSTIQSIDPPPGSGATVAVNVTSVFRPTGFGDASTVTLDGAWVRTMSAGALSEAPNVAVPRNWATSVCVPTAPVRNEALAIPPATEPLATRSPSNVNDTEPPSGTGATVAVR